MKKFLLLFLAIGFTMNINAQERFDHVIVQDNWDMYSGQSFHALTTPDGPTYYRWTPKYGVSFSDISPSIVTLYGSGSFEFEYYAVFSPTHTLKMTIRGKFIPRPGGGGSGGDIKPIPKEPGLDQPVPMDPFR